MSMFGWSLPGTTGHYDAQRNRRAAKRDTRPRRGAGQAGIGRGAPWYERQDIQFGGGLPFLEGTGGLGMPEGGFMPEWAAPQYGSDVGAFYEGFQAEPMAHRGLETLYQQNEEENARQTAGLARFDELFGEGGERYGSALERYGEFAPQLAETTSLWERMAAPDYKAVSDYALQPALAEQTRAGAQYSRTAADQMAARGLGRSGLSASLQGAGAGMAAQGRGMVRAGQATANEEMRRQAANQLMRSQGLEVGLAELMGGVEADQARYGLAGEALRADIEAGHTQFDPLAVFSLLHGLEKEEEQFDFIQSQLDASERALEEATQFDLGDFLWKGLETFFNAK